MSYADLPEVTREVALKTLEKDAQDPVYYHGRVAKVALDYIRALEGDFQHHRAALTKIRNLLEEALEDAW